MLHTKMTIQPEPIIAPIVLVEEKKRITFYGVFENKRSSLLEGVV